MDKKELIEFFERYKSNIRYKSDDPRYKSIIQLTLFLDENYSLGKITFTQRIWHIRHNEYNIKVCRFCGKQIKWRKDISDYGKICNSNKCKSEYHKTKEYQSLLKNSFKKKYGTENPFKLKELIEKSKQTCKERYGSETYLTSDIGIKNIKKICLERYGVDNPLKSRKIQNKYKQKVKKLYGNEIYFRTSNFIEKSRKTFLKRYGVDSYSKTDEFKERIKKTCLKRYGVDSHSKTDEFKNRFIKIIENDLISYGLYEIGYRVIKKLDGSNYVFYCPKCKKEFNINVANSYWHRRKYHQEICTNCNPLYKNYSCGEKDVLSYVLEIYSGTVIENTKEVIYPYELDIYLPDLKLAIEYNGDYWHANPDLYSKDEKISGELASDIWEKDIKKINRCYSKDITLIVVWENDWINNKKEVQSLIAETISTLS